MNVVLIGFKSCGKSTVGKLLADQRQLRFVDLDDAIVEIFRTRFGLNWNCWEFYFSYGADKFREVETRALKGLTEREGIVLATGGGAPLQDENRAELARLGTICYIKTPPEILFDRMRRKKLPAYLTEKPTLANMRRIWIYRDDVYEKLADVVIDAADRGPNEIAAEINKALN